MPWKPKDAIRFTKKANTDRRRGLWSETANDERKARLKAGDSAKAADAAAVRAANRVIRNDVESRKRRAA